MEPITPFNPLKILAHRDKIEQILNGEIPRPIRVVLEPTNVCNHACMWCFYKKFRDINKVQLSNEKLDELVGDFKTLGVKEVSITGGGDPLAHTYLDVMIRKLHGIGIKTSITTNGGILNDKLMETIVRHCTYIRIGLDAATKEMHDKLHCPKKGDFNEILSHISSMIELRKRFRSSLAVGLKFLVCDLNYMEIPKIAEVGERYGVDYIQFGYVRGEYHPTSEKARMIGDKMIDEAKKRTSLTISGKLIKPHANLSTKCLTTPLIATISANGHLYICGFMDHAGDEYSIGNINKTPLVEIWESEKHKTIIGSLDPKDCLNVPCKMKIYNQIIKDVFIDNKMHVDSI